MSRQLVIDDITPSTVARAGGKHPKTSKGAPCPHSLARAIEEGALYFTAGGQTPIAVGGKVLLNAVDKVVPGDGTKQKFDAIPNVLDGMPAPKKSALPPIEALHSLRTRNVRLDTNTVDVAVRKIAAEPRRRSPSNSADKIRLLSHPSLMTCQSRFHDSDEPASSVGKNRRIIMCNSCWGNYKFKRPGKAQRYYGLNNIRKSARLWMHMQPLFSATPEAFCGYVAVCSAQTTEFKATPSLPVKILEEIGLTAALYLWAMPYANGSYTALRLLHTARPERATVLQTRIRLRRPAKELLWWKRAEEQGFTTRPLEQLRRSGWSSPLQVATPEHAIAWDKKYAYSVSALGVAAAVAGIHKKIKCVIKTLLGESKSAPISRLPSVKMTRSGTCTIRIQAAENVTWAYAWRCLCKAEDVAESIGIKESIEVTLELEGNPLAEPKTMTPDPAWDAVMKTPHAPLIPKATGHFFKWALPYAAERVALPSLTTADMYPATAEKVEELKTGVKSGFPPTEDVPLREAAKVVFGDGSLGGGMEDIPLLGGDAV